jgi:hypothetical protein
VIGRARNLVSAGTIHGVVPLAPAQKQLWLKELELNGFVVLRGFLPVDLVHAMREELAPLLEAEYRQALADGFKKGRGAGRLSLHLGPYADLMRGALADPRYRQHPVIEELVDAVLGPGAWEPHRMVVESVWQGSAFMGWHSDQMPEETARPAEVNRPIRVTYNIPLVDFTWSTGATEFLPGSHHLPRNYNDDFDLRLVPHVWPVRPELRVGDALLRDGHTLHRGTPNLSDAPRPMLDRTYRLKGVITG